MDKIVKLVVWENDEIISTAEWTIPTNSSIKQELIERVAYFAGTLVDLGQKVYFGKPLLELKLDDLSSKQILAIYEDCIQAYWRSKLLQTEGYSQSGELVRRTAVAYLMENILNEPMFKEFDIDQRDGAVKVIDQLIASLALIPPAKD